MMQEIQPSIWNVRSENAGKTITVIGGTHGNERTGVEVVTTLQRLVDSGTLTIAAGTLTLIYGNPRAIALNERGSEPHRDLNRRFPTDLLDQPPTGEYEDTRAREIAPQLQESDIVIDIHSTNKPSEPFLCCLHSAERARIYRWFACNKVLADPHFVLGGKSCTTDEYTEAHGGVGICYETGQAADTRRANEVVRNVIDLLIDQGLVKGSPSVEPMTTREIYEMVESILLTDAGFQFAEGFGEHSWAPFIAGQTIGSHGEEPLRPTYDGVIVFPTIQKHQQVGKALGYLVKSCSVE